MSLYLVQHGKANKKEIDPEKGLSDDGIRDVRRIADVARGYCIHVSCIKHSGKKRALQTAELFASVIGAENGIKEINCINPKDDVVGFAEDADFEDDLMVVGHLPFMEKLVSYLVTGSIEKSIFKFQNGGIVCLEKNTDMDSWLIKWTLMPRID